MPITTYEDLIVWQRSMNLIEEVYPLALRLPKYETYGLADQMRRAVISIPSNIAEGQGRGTKAEFIHFLYIARGSCFELDTQLKACVHLKYVGESDVEKTIELNTEIGKMLSSLISKIKSSADK